jgi:hypothetical protein
VNFKQALKPLVEKIKDSNSGAADQAKYLLDDQEYTRMKVVFG